MLSKFQISVRWPNIPSKIFCALPYVCANARIVPSRRPWEFHFRSYMLITYCYLSTPFDNVNLRGYNGIVKKKENELHATSLNRWHLSSWFLVLVVRYTCYNVNYVLTMNPSLRQFNPSNSIYRLCHPAFSLCKLLNIHSKLQDIRV